MGFNSSQDMVNEVSRVFNEEVSASHVRRIRRKNSNKIGLESCLVFIEASNHFRLRLQKDTRFA